MPASIVEAVDETPDAATAADHDHHGPAAADPLGDVRPGSGDLNCPSCGSVHVAQVLGDNGGISFVCTACGHAWS